MNFFRWKWQSPSPQGVHFGTAAAVWAETRFQAHLRPMAAFVADVLCQQVGLTLPELEPDSKFIEDLHVDEEAVEFVMALEEDLGFGIPDADAVMLQTVSDLVCYLHLRLESHRQPSPV